MPDGTNHLQSSTAKRSRPSRARPSGRSPSASAPRFPHLCYAPEPGYRPDGNCRACMVEIEGERVLAASCIRQPTEGMKVVTGVSERAKKSREMVFELLVADQPARETAHDPQSKFWNWAEQDRRRRQPLCRARQPAPDSSHTAMRGQPGCLHQLQSLRPRLPRGPGQRRDRHGLSRPRRQGDLRLRRSHGRQHLRCLRRMRPGLPDRRADGGQSARRGKGVRTEYEDRSVDTLCPYCGVGCQTTVHVKDDKILYIDGRDGPANQQRLCVKGRFGFDYISHPGPPDQAADPARRRAQGWAEDQSRSGQPSGPTSARRPGMRRSMRPPRLA